MFQSWVQSSKSSQHKIFYKMEMPKLFMDREDNSSGQQLTSFFPLFQEETGNRL